MNLAELAKLSHSLEKETLQPNETIILYGEPGTGKTEYGGTIAKSPDIDRVYWFDGENGSETLFRMIRDGKLTEAEAAKIILIKVQDLPHRPYFQETIIKCFTLEKDLKICQLHGRVNCPTCITAKVESGWLDFNLYKLGKRDCVVVDTGSQFADSIMSYLCKGQEIDFKPGWDEFGPQGRILHDVLSVVQAGTTNHIWIAHQLVHDDVDDINKDAKQTKDKFYPRIGTKNFSMGCAKYFGTKAHLKKKLGKHAGSSGSTSTSEAIVSSREGMLIEEDIGLKNLAEVIAKARQARAASKK